MEITVEKGILYIKLVNPPMEWESNNKHYFDGRFLHKRVESLKVIETMSVSKFFGNKASLVAINGSIEFVFKFINPFSINNISIRRSKNQLPRIVDE